MKTTLAAFLLGVSLIACGASDTAAPAVHLLRVPEGGVQPQALLDANGDVHLIYLKGDPKACNVMYCRRPKGKSEFTQPIRVNSMPGSAIALGTVRGAQFAFGRHGILHVVWNGSDQASTAPGGGAPMLYARSRENGDGFESQRNLMTSTTHLDGGGSVAADPFGHVYVVWHGHRKTGPQEEIDRGVFVAFSADDGKSFTVERQVNPASTGACGCCGLKAFADSSGALAILYRTANLQGNRDSELLMSTNFGRSFAERDLGNWHLSTCPMSTHALGPGAGGIGAAWEIQGQIYFQSALLGQSRAVAASGGNGDRKHPTFAVNHAPSSSMILAWTEGTGWEKGGALAWECVDAAGAQIASGRVDGIPVWSYAAAVADTAEAFTLIY